MNKKKVHRALRHTPFFPSVEQARVWKRLQSQPFNFPKQIANVLAGLCSMRQERDVADETKKHDNDKKFKFVLPQGSPVSPIITNMVCDTLDRRLAGLARRFGLKYSRYADDITFSSMHYVYAPNGKFYKEMCRLISEQGFMINEEKTRLQKLGARQEVTGIIVSDKLNVTQKYIRDIRNILYIWDRYGYTEALSKFFRKYNKEKGHVKKVEPDLQNVINGKLMYLKMVKGEEDSVYMRLFSKFKKLVNRDFGSEKTNTYGITYVDSRPLLKFEKDNNTNIIFRKNDKNKRYAIFKIGAVNKIASINKSVTQDDEKHKERLIISYCKSSKGEYFWFIHNADKMMIFKASQIVNVDELNKDLDTLLKL